MNETEMGGRQWNFHHHNDKLKPEDRQHELSAIQLQLSITALKYWDQHRQLAVSKCSSKSVLLHDWQFTAIRLGDKPLETHDQYFFFPTEHLLL
jgi:hypothetical protein